jgi:predicted membrane channel-forming protein YqfA (hemolysin III family)
LKTFFEALDYFAIFLFLASAIIAISNIQRSYENTRSMLFIVLGIMLIALSILSYTAFGILTLWHIRYTDMAFFASMLVASVYAFSRSKRKIDMTNKRLLGMWSN